MFDTCILIKRYPIREIWQIIIVVLKGNDLYDVEKVAHSYQEVRVKKQDTLREVLQSLSSQLNVPPQKMRIWPMNHRTNQTLRPSLIDTEGDLDKAIIEGMQKQLLNVKCQ